MKDNIPEYEGPTLTTLQRQVMVHVRQGYTNKKVAEILGINCSSVEQVLGRIYKVFGIENTDDINPRVTAVSYYQYYLWLRKEKS